MEQQPITRSELLIEPAELMQRIAADKAQSQLRIFDATVISGKGVSPSDGYDRYLTGHIPGAAFLDHQKLADPDSPYALMVPDDDYLGRALGELGIGNDTEVVVYATSTLAWATRIWWLLNYAGHRNVRVLNGGLDGWEAAGGALETGEARHTPVVFNVSSAPGWFVKKEDVLANIGSERVMTLNTLTEDVFEQGHIAGSSCVPCLNFLEAGASLLPDAELKHRLGDFDPDQEIITYCGGGVAATVNAVVHRLVGNPRVAVYDGSMSEWAGEGLPME